MFKRLRDKLAEEVRQSNLNVNLGHFIGQDDDVAATSGLEGATSDAVNNASRGGSGGGASEQASSVMEGSTFADDLPSAGEKLVQSPQTNAAAGRPPSRQRTFSTSSQSSEPAVLPVHNSPDRPRYVPQSDTESEIEGPVMLDLSQVTKEQLFEAFQKCKQKVERYRNKHSEVVRAYRVLNEEKEKVAKVLTESQDKALRRINELREQADLEQRAKAHLEENLRLIMDEKDEKLKVMQTKVDLLSNSEEVVKPFKEQVRQLNLDLQSKEADVIMAKELRSQAEKELAKVRSSLQAKEKELKELQLKEAHRLTTNLDETKLSGQDEDEVKRLKQLLDDKDRELHELRLSCRAVSEQSKATAATSICNGEKAVEDHVKASSAIEHWEAKMRASEKKLSQKENELRKIARKMHQLKLMVIAEEAEEEESISSSDDGLAKKIEGSVDQLLNEKHQLQKTIDDLHKQCKRQEEEMHNLRTRLESSENTAQERFKQVTSQLEDAVRERDVLRGRLEEELNRANIIAQEGAQARREATELAKEKASVMEKLKESDIVSRELQKKTDELCRQMEDLESRMTTVRTECESKTNCVLHLEEQIKQLNHEKNVLEKQLSESSKRSQDNNNFAPDDISMDSVSSPESTEECVDDTTKENELLRRQVAELKDRCKILSEKLETFSALREQMKDDTDDMKEADAKLAKAISELKNKVREEAAAKESLKNDSDKLLEELAAAQKALISEKADTANVVKQLEDLRREHEKLHVEKDSERNDLQTKLLVHDEADINANREDIGPPVQSSANPTAQTQLDDLTALVAALEADLAKERERVADLCKQQEVDRVKADELRDSLSLAVSEAQAKNEQLEARLAQALADTLKTAEAKSIVEKELKARLSKKEHDLEAATHRWDSAAKEKNALETRLLEQENDFETQRGKLNQEIRSLNAKVDQLEAQLKDSPEIALRAELASKEAELAEARAKATAASEDAEQMKRAVELKSQELIKVVDELANRERLHKEADNRILKLEAHFADRIRALESKLAEADEKLRRTEKEREVLMENADRLDKMYRQLEGQLKQVEQEGKLRVANVEARLIVEKDKLSKTEEIRSRLESAKAKLEASLKSSHERIHSLEEIKNRLEDQLGEKRLECENWQESLKTGDERNTKVRQELKDALATIQELRQDIQVAEERVREEFTARIESMEITNNTLTERHDALIKELDSCRQELESARLELSVLKESPVQKENLQLRQSLRAAEEERERLSREAERYRDDLERATRQAELLGKEAKALRDCSGDEIDTLREQMDEYKNQSILAQERCEKLQQELDVLRKRCEEKDRDDGWDNHGAWDEDSEWVAHASSDSTANDAAEATVPVDSPMKSSSATLLNSTAASASTATAAPDGASDVPACPDSEAPAVLEVAVVEETRVVGSKSFNPQEGCDSVESLRMQLAKQHDEIRDLKALLGLHSRGGLMADMPGPTEYEYLKNIMFNFMMGKETQTLCKVIAAVLRFSREQTQLVTERHESLHKVHALYGSHLAMTAGSAASHATVHPSRSTSHHRPPH